MYVCICHGLTDSDVESAEKNGATQETEVFCHYGVKPQCGKCIPSMRCLMKCSRKTTEPPAEEKNAAREFLPRRLAFQV